MREIGKREDPVDGVTPYLTVSDGAAAVAFYEKAFGAIEVFRGVADDDRRIMHSQLKINGGVVFLSDHFAEYEGGGPPPVPAAMLLHLAVKDADAWWDRAIAAGAAPVIALADQFWGDRWGVLKDPFGHSWSIGAPIKA
ncbi:MAG: VOC family protein [Hyphomonadaceae bacterium]|nr:VOC family protein [Hyphomonadaceae bacterium]